MTPGIWHQGCCCEGEGACQHCDKAPLIYEVTLTGLGGPYAADLNGQTEELEEVGPGWCQWDALIEAPGGGHYAYSIVIWAEGNYGLVVEYNENGLTDEIFNAGGAIAGRDCWDGLETPINNILWAGGQAAVVRG